jgi:hypothetical protein
MADKQFFQYNGTITHSGRRVPNLARRVTFVQELKDDAVLTGEYMVRDGETAWSLAQDFYEDPSYYWLIICLNNAYDPFFLWPMSSVELDKYTENKWGDKADDTSYWILNKRRWNEDPEHPEAAIVTFRRNEEIQNERRRKIKILRPEYLNRALREYESLSSNRREPT